MKCENCGDEFEVQADLKKEDHIVENKLVCWDCLDCYVSDNWKWVGVE